MAKTSAKNAIIIVNSQTIVDATSYNINYAVDSLDVTAFTDGAHNFAAGMPVREITIDFIWNTAATTGSFTVLQPLVGTNTTVSIQPEGTGKALSGTFLVVNINPQGTPSSDIKLGSVKFVPGTATAPTWA
jgi:hypothetical protein